MIHKSLPVRKKHKWNIVNCKEYNPDSGCQIVKYVVETESEDWDVE